MTQKKIQAKEVLGTEYYNYNITSTNYNPSLNTTITITVTVTDVYGSPVNNLSTTLQRNGTSISSKNTNSSGVATWTYTCSASGLQKFHVGENTINVYVDNKSELGHTHSQYLTSHQDISGKANTSDLGAVAFSNNYNDLSNKPNIPSAVTVDTTLSSSSDNAIANSTVKNALDNKLDKTHTSYKGKNVVTNASTGTIEFEEKNNHTHSEYLTSHQDISGKIDTAGTGLSKTGTTLNHSNSVTALTTASFKKVKYDSQGHVTGTSDVSASDLPSHTHEKSQITDFPSIPSASNTTPSADTQSGSVGTGTTWARSNHTHPKSSLYAESSHTHDQYLTAHQDITEKEDSSNKVSSWSSTTNNTRYPTEKLVKDSLDGKQATLVSGTNLKTINNTSLLGSGNITITSGGASVNVDSALSTTSENPVQNKVITNKINKLGDIDTPVTHGLDIFGTDSIYGEDYSLWSRLFYDSLVERLYYLKNGDALTDEIATIGDIPSVPSASNTTPNADTSSGASGTGTTWARADHTHPQSTIYAPSSHASTSTTYGVATASNYGHTKVINNLTTSANSNGESLSAYQGKVLNDTKADKSEVIDVDNIVFVDKSDDSTGAIILNFLS